MRSAIAAKADAIVTTSPDPGSMNDVVNEAHAAGIPVININTPDPTVDFDAYVGMDLVFTGKKWAQYLVDKGLVKAGDFVWMPVEVPGATYGVQEEEGIKSVFEPLGITWEVTDNTLDQAEVITRMSDYLTANRAKVKAIIGLGDLVTGSIKRVFDQVGVKPGEIPVVGWGNSLDTTQEVLTGYVNAAHVAGPAGDELCRPVARRHGRERHPAGIRRAGRQSLREGRRPGRRRHPVRQVAASVDSRPRRPAPPRGSLPRQANLRRDMALAQDTSGARGRQRRPAAVAHPAPDRQAGVRAVRPPGDRTGRLHRDQPDFLSPLNISNTLVFTVELGLIALAMTLLMTAGEFDLSVGAVFGFSPIVMWTLFNQGDHAARARLRRRHRHRRP